MSKVHFLNVKEGDCSIIEHASGHVSVIDVCNARKEETSLAARIAEMIVKSAGSGNLNQKAYPVNPIEYLKEHGIASIFRFIITHPDMDHLDGIKDLFVAFSPTNFYDIDNSKEIEFNEQSPYREEDWKFYKKLRDTKPQINPKRITVFSGDTGIHRAKDWELFPPCF